MVMMTLCEGIVPLPATTAIFQRTSIFSEWTGNDTRELARILDNRWVLKLVENPATSDPLEWSPSLWKELAGGTSLPAGLAPPGASRDQDTRSHTDSPGTA